MNKLTSDSTKSSKKPKRKPGKYHEKFVVDATFDELLHMVLTTPKKRKAKKQA